MYDRKLLETLLSIHSPSGYELELQKALIKETKDICPSQCSQWRFVPSEWTEEALIRDKKLLFTHYI